MPSQHPETSLPKFHQPCILQFAGSIVFQMSFFSGITEATVQSLQQLHLLTNDKWLIESHRVSDSESVLPNRLWNTQIKAKTSPAQDG